MKFFFSFTAAICLLNTAISAQQKGYYRTPAIYQNIIVFTAEGDLWKYDISTNQWTWINGPDTTVLVQKVGEAEVDEMWSFVGAKTNPRWLWHALEPQTGNVLADVCGRRNDRACLALQAVWRPFGLTRFYPEGWGAYQRHCDPALHEVDKRNTQP